MRCEIWDFIPLLKHQYDAALEPICKTYDVTRMELDILLFLANNAMFDTASDIVRYRRLSKSHVSISNKALIEKGYLVPFYKDDNRKSIHLHITEASSSIIRDGQAAQKSFFDMVFKGFSMEEKEMMIQCMLRISNNVHKARGGN